MTAKEKRKAYAIIAGVLSHELMHIHQYKYSYEKYSKDFVYESKLPKNTDKWTVFQRKKYDNLPIELEAQAFGMLVESTILQTRRVSTLHTYTNRYQYKKVYLQLKNIYENKARVSFTNCLNRRG